MEGIGAGVGTRGGDSIDPFKMIIGSVEVMLVLVEVSDVGTGNLVCALTVGGIVS